MEEFSGLRSCYREQRSVAYRRDGGCRPGKSFPNSGSHGGMNGIGVTRDLRSFQPPCLHHVKV